MRREGKACRCWRWTDQTLRPTPWSSGRDLHDVDESHKEENKVEANNTGSGEKKMPSEVVRKGLLDGEEFW